jgi:tetratricopeptide (TPR) repeat protein
VEAASIVNASYGQCAVTPQLLRTVSLICDERLDLDDKIHILLAQSMLFYGISDLTSSLNSIREATQILEMRKTANSALAMLHNGVGAILAKQGQYLASISAYLECHRIASRIGNDAIGLQASSNLALSLVRIGDYEKAISWADRVFGCQQTCLVPYCHLTAAQSSLIAHAMLKKRGRVEEAIQAGNVTFDNCCSAARSQRWALHAADAYAMLGKLEQAHEAGWRATSGINSEVHLDCYVGSYARWLARTSIENGRVVEGRERLDRLVENLDSYDAMDRAETINARTWLRARAGGVSSGEIDHAWSYLTVLPSAVPDQLRRMGMLDFCND